MNIFLEQMKQDDHSMKTIVKKNIIFKYGSFLVLVAIYFLQRFSFEQLNSSNQQKGKKGEEVIITIEQINLERTRPVIKIYNDLHGQMMNVMVWIKQVWNLIQIHIRISMQAITNFRKFNKSLYLVVIFDNILLNSNNLALGYLEVKLQYKVDYSDS